MKKWLSERLTPEQKKIPAWVELADAIQLVFDNHFNGVIEQLRRLKSVFGRTHEELDSYQQELGEFFSVQFVEEDLKALSLVHRFDDIHYKDTLVPFVNSIKREFAIEVAWLRKYAPIDQTSYPYGSRFKPESDVSKEDTEHFLTCRGDIEIDISTVLGKSDEELLHAVNTIKQRFNAHKPLRTVLDAVIVKIRYLTVVFIDYSVRYSEAVQDRFQHVTGTTAIAHEMVAQSTGFIKQPLQMDAGASRFDMLAHFDQVPSDGRKQRPYFKNGPSRVDSVAIDSVFTDTMVTTHPE